MKYADVFILMACLGLIARVVEGKKILMVPASQISHVKESLMAAEAMIARGHEVHMVMPSNFPNFKMVTDSGIRPMIYQVPEGGITFGFAIQKHLDPFEQKYSKSVELEMTIEFVKEECRHMLRDRHLMTKLTEQHYDLSVTDGFIAGKCLFLVPYNLSIPFVYMFTGFIDTELGIPSLPSFVVPFVVPYSPYMSFLERIKNIFAFYMMHSLAGKCDDISLRETYAPGTSSLLDIVLQSQLFISTRDYVLEYPAPTLPNVLRVPILALAEAKPLPGELNDLIENTAFNGVVVVSFGTSIDKFPIQIFNKFMDGFKQFKDLLFIFRVSKELVETRKSSKPSNVQLMTWLPQQDIIGHPKTRLFITHCGNNGQYEAVYHGVPMLGFPLFGDQHHNCHRMKVQGIGEYLHIVDFSVEQLKNYITQLLTTPSYLEKVQHKRDILRHQPHPKNTVATWLEHIMLFGGKHLRSQSQDMPTYEFLMLDIIGFLSLVLSFIFIICVCFCRYVVKRCFKKGPKDKLA